MLKNFLLLICAFCAAGVLRAQSVWLEIPANAAPVAGERRIVPEKYRAMRLNLNALQPVLASAPEAFSAASGPENLPIIEVPTPDGRLNRFQITETPVLAPALQAKYPGIRSYTGRGVVDGTAKIKLDVTPWGFHAMVTSAKHGAYFIDPMLHGNTEDYVVYFKKDYVKKADDTPWTCGTPSPDGAVVLEQDHHAIQTATPDFQGDTKLRRYRLALACTGEYAAFHGGTKILALAAMVTSMNRVNGVYETDFGVTMQIIPNNDVLIYLNASTDPYTNNDGGAMLGQNQSTVSTVIGSANYDIGHVFSTGGGGVAYLGVVCGSSNKAGGVTGSGAPVGDPFDIDYVAHEIGHQFAGNHTFNHCGSNNNDPAAVEPGSGTTIMAYAGICGGDDVAPHSEDIFHGYNIAEMGAFIYSGGGNNCPVKINSGNNNPVVDAGPNYVIPKSTPFALTAIGSDVNGDTLTYTWEQMDTGNAASPPTPSTSVGPMFRSYKGDTSATRVFPRLVDIVNNVNPVWEELPGVARTMNFRVTARDNDWIAGCTDEDDMAITVTATSGPFLVTVPNTNISWRVGDTQTVTWDVANTTAAPVSCSTVRISLSLDGGFTYPVILAGSEPNDGSATIIVPNNLSNTCRIKVEGLGNIFFDISNANFRIEPPLVPTFFLSTSVPSTTACAGESASFNAEFTTALGFNMPTNVTVTGAPVGSTLAITPNPVTPAGTANITISGLTPAMAGVYTLNIEAVSGTISRSGTVVLTVLPGSPAEANLTLPANGSVGQSTATILNWSSPFADSALVEVATNPSFSAGSLVSVQTVNGNTATVGSLLPSTVYYWRARCSNSCGTAGYSAVFAFQTGANACGNNFASTDVPKAIDQATINTAVSTLNIPANSIIEDANVSITISHSYVGDIGARLVSASNDTIVLFDRPGVPASPFGCGGTNANLVFDDQAALPATALENQCNGNAPALSGTYQSVGSLAALSGKSAQGTWKLLVGDSFAEDGGNITAWSVSLCFPSSLVAGSILVNNPLLVPSAGNGTVAAANLQMTTTGTAVQGQYILTSLPAHGSLLLNGTALSIGGVFTQADIDAGLLTYSNNGDASLTDNFHFDALDANNNAWVHDGIFNINVVFNNLVVTALQTQDLLCPDDSNGAITATATGLDGAYTYSLNGGMPQASNVFTGLNAGTYTVVVTGQFGFTAAAGSVIITNPDAIVVNASSLANTVTVVASGGAGGFEYSINGVDFQPSAIFNDLSNGTYTVTVRDANGCTATTPVVVSIDALIVSTLIQNQVSCAGGNDGAIQVNVVGGLPPYNYSLNGAASQPDNVFSGLSAGTYTVAITDNFGFTAETSAIVLDNPAAISAAASAVLNVVTVTASGGTGVLNYSLNGGMFQTGNVFPGLTNGTYNVTVRDERGCTASTTVVVDVAPLALSATFNASLNCFGAADGVITALATGGIPPLEYKLNNGAYQSSNVFSGLSGGAYMVWVRDAVGTEVSFAVAIAEPAPLLVMVTVIGRDADFLLTGGMSPYTFSTNAPNGDLQNLPNGIYTMTVTDANGCTVSTSFEVNVAPLAWSSVVTNATCFGQNNGSTVVTATGGIPPYEYSFNGGAFQSSNIFEGIAPGAYMFIIRDADGFEISGNISITAPAPVSISATVTGNNISAVSTGGTSPYQYSLNGGALQSNGDFSNLSPGNYTVVVTDANGCTASISNLIVNTAVVEPAEAWGLSVSPNPGTGLFQLNMQQAPPALSIEVYDAAGRRMRALNFAPNGGVFSTALDLRDLPNGTYILRLTDGRQWGGVRLSKVD